MGTSKSKVFDMRKKALQWHQNTNRSGLGSSIQPCKPQAECRSESAQPGMAAAAKVETLAVAADSVEIQHADWEGKLAGERPLPTCLTTFFILLISPPCQVLQLAGSISTQPSRTTDIMYVNYAVIIVYCANK